MTQATPDDSRPPVNGHPVPDLLITGPADDAPAGPTARSHKFAGTARRLLSPRLRPRLDLRLLRGLMAVGLVALFGSLVAEWRRYRMPDIDQVEGDLMRDIPVHLGDLGVLATGYLVAVIVLVGCAVLALFGPAAGRGHMRILGLAMAGAGAATVAAIALSDASDTLNMGPVLYAAGVAFESSTQGGVWAATLGCALIAAALYLLPRIPEYGTVPSQGVAVGPEPEAEAPEWREPTVPRVADERPAAPMDLSVEAVEPFHHLDERRDPWR